MSELLLVLGVAVLGMALRNFRHPIMVRLGVLCILATTFLAVYFLTDSIVAGITGAAIWLFLPWFELVTRVRRIRLPRSRNLRIMHPPDADDFPALEDLTREVTDEGFEHVKDAGWEWEQFRQFFRIFYRADDRALAAICLNKQQELQFFYLSIMSRDKDGRLWLTWNYPFTPSMKLPPSFSLNPQRADLSFFDMYQNHLGFLLLNGVSQDKLLEQDEDRIDEGLSGDLQEQIAHNLKAGLLTPVSDREVRYSWRGLVYIWAQFLLEFVRVR